MNFTPSWLSWPETQELIKAFSAHNEGLRFVGGAVRDALLQRPVTDVDAATPLTPNDVMALLSAADIQAIPTGINHGTITAVIGKKHFEITTLRKDVATDGRHAQVEYTDDWQEDAKRRDFTMNALYLSPAGQLTDYFGGAQDAKEGRVKFIGDAPARIREDYLRILRFFRFFAHYGKTTPDNEALKACAAAAAHIERLSAERIQHEMLKLLSAPKSYHAIEFMIEHGVFMPTFGVTLANAKILARLEEMTTAFAQNVSVAAKLLTLVANSEALAKRWKLSNELAEGMKILQMLHANISVSLSFPQQKKFIRRYGNDTFTQAVMLVWAEGDEMISKGHPYHAMLVLARQWQAPKFTVSGKDLQALGIEEGKRIGEILRELEEAWEAADYKTSKEELLARVK